MDIEKIPFIDTIVKNVSKISLQGGLAGKICRVVICVSFAIAVVAWSFRNIFVTILSLTMIFLLAFMMLWRLINLANKNPQTALMDGAEFLVHEQMMIAAKNIPEKVVRQTDLSENKPVDLSLEEIKLLNKPDDEVK